MRIKASLRTCARLLVFIGLLLLTPNVVRSQTETAALPILLDNTSGRMLNAKLIGPVSKTITLGYSTTVMLMLPPGTYRFFYRFEGDDEGTYLYVKSPDFTLDPKTHSPYFTVIAYPFEVVSPIPEPQNRIKPISAREFNEAVVSTAAGANQQEFAKQLDGLRFSEIDVIASIGELYEADTDKKWAQTSLIVKPYLNRYIVQNLLPQLRKQGFKPTYLGIKEAPETFSKPTLTISYEESQGDAFTFNYQETVYGISIDCWLSLDNPRLKKPDTIWKQRFITGTEAGIRANIMNPTPIFRRNALVNLGYHFKDMVLALDDWKPK
jgi:hypothetical protein